MDEHFPFHVKAATGESILLNSPKFRVTASADFVLDVPWQVSFTSQGSGYIMVIFLDKAGKGIVRANLLEPGWAPLGIAKTDSAGKFTFSLAHEAANFTDLRLRFDGSDALRPRTTGLERPNAR